MSRERSAPLDMCAFYMLRALGGESGTSLVLAQSGGDRRAAGYDALRAALRVAPQNGAARAVAFDARGVAALPASWSDVRVEVQAGGRAVVLVEIAGDDVRPRHLLSPFELRYLADTGHVHPVPPGLHGSAGPARLATDLHTHFAGCVAPGDLLAIGESHGAAIPGALLEEAGIRGVAGAASIPELSAEARARYAAALAVPLDRRVTFRDMERIYRLRAPITKHRPSFGALLAQIARDYARRGVEYVELSLADVVEPEVLDAVHRVAPTLEREHGVTLRFLAAINRHDDPEWDLDLLERIAELAAGSLYVVGVDFMGHETNSTRAFRERVELAGAIASRRPGFVVRVHAGESPAHPENVRVAAEALAGSGAQIRIGHGLHGVDAGSLDVLRDTGAVVEFNLDSNIALNSLTSARAVPIERYAAHGVPVVLGSDGYGVYASTPESLVRAALLAGGDAALVLGALAAAERAHLEGARLRDAALVAGASAYAAPPKLAPRHYGAAVAASRAAERARRDAALDARIQAIGARLLSAADVVDLARGRPLLAWAGAWHRSFAALDEGARALVERTVDAAVSALAPRRPVFVTGGTAHGVEGLVGRAARSLGLTVVGAIVRETPPSSLDPARFEHLCVVGETLYDKAGGLYALVAAAGGASVFVGGGQIVSDEIQTAVNLRLPYFVMSSVPGASADHARERPERAFADADELVRALARGPMGCALAPHWFSGPNPTADAVVLRRGAAGLEVLLVLRDVDAPAEPGRWALPGGFVATSARRGCAFVPDRETAAAACVRELREEAGVELDERELVEVGRYEGAGRDPRDSPEAWARSTAFAVLLDDARARRPVVGGDDAADAGWFDVEALPDLAFDHARIVADALGVVTATAGAASSASPSPTPRPLG